jgi:hypothetical protein
LPDGEKADFAAFVDIERLVAIGRDQMSAGDRLNVESLDALGVTAAANGDGEFRMRMKLVTK